MLFGARDNHEELLFSDFFTQFFERDPKNKLFLACSREIEENQLKSLENVFTYKGYVQDMIKDERFYAGKLIQLQMNYQSDKVCQPKMMICGNQSAMGKQVFEVLTHCKVFGESDEEQK